ncbi:MAG TPA: TA system VapC family ribonuclease toxin [Acidimicrobiia bacterium]|nr:TA system VapC family ribonuclease toxin [Acidimicrobiia bacterium]
MIAVDTNILIYAHRAETGLHAEARSALARLVEGLTPWGLPVFVLGEFLRVVTHPAVLDPPTSREVALAALRSIVATPTCRVLNALEGYSTVLESVVAEAKVEGNAVLDAQIVAVCQQHGVDEILTEDRGLRRFPMRMATLA